MTYFLGHYFIPDADTTQLKLKAPIEWVPLAVKGDVSLLITKDCIGSDFYDLSLEQHCLWNESGLKEVCDDLYKEIFSEEEKEAIVEQPIGKIFVLSEKEIETYLPIEESRRAVRYSISDNNEILVEHSAYWLRKDNMSEDLDNLDVPYINSLGKIEYSSSDADEIGIRAAIYVDTKKARFLSGKVGFNWSRHSWSFEEF